MGFGFGFMDLGWGFTGCLTVPSRGGSTVNVFPFTGIRAEGRAYLLAILGGLLVQIRVSAWAPGAVCQSESTIYAFGFRWGGGCSGFGVRD